MTGTNSITLMTQEYHTNDSKSIILMTETNGIITASYTIILMTQRNSIILMTETNSITLMTQSIVSYQWLKEFRTLD